MGEFATYFNPALHERSVDVQLQLSGSSANPNRDGWHVPSPPVGALTGHRGRPHSSLLERGSSLRLKRARVCTSSDVALSILINTTDICSSFIRCPRPGQIEQRCRARPGAAWQRQVQGLYGAFREAYLTSPPPRSTSPLSAARVAVRSVCAEQMDLVVSHRCNEPVLAPLAQLLAQVPLGVCVRVLVLERCVALSGRTAAYKLPSMDAREQLFNIRRIVVPRTQGTLQAYQSWAADSEDIVSSVMFLPDAWNLQLQDVRSCATHSLFSSLTACTGLVTVQLGSIRLVRLATAAMMTTTQAEVDAAMLSANNLRASRVTQHTGDYSQCQLGLLAMLLSAAARAKTTARLTPTVMPRLGFRREEKLALSCLDPDFMQNNRALLPLPASQSSLLCDQNATAEDAARFDRLVATIQQHGGASNDGAGRHSAQLQQRCELQQLLRTNLLPAGWFSTLHGLIKPLSHALRLGKTLLTPAVQVILPPLPNSTAPCPNSHALHRSSRRATSVKVDEEIWAASFAHWLPRATSPWR